MHKFSTKSGLIIAKNLSLNPTQKSGSKTGPKTPTQIKNATCKKYNILLIFNFQNFF